MFYLASVLLAITILPQTSLCLWPAPRTMSAGTSFLTISPAFDIILSGVLNPPQDLADAIARTKNYVNNDHLQRLVPGRGANDASKIRSAKTLSTLKVTLANGSKARSIMAEATAPIGSRQEGYSLTVPADGSAATLTANSTLGLFRGLTTFSQLWFEVHDAVEKTVYTNMAPVTISGDSPAFPYRGFMLDTSRNFFPVADIKRTLDAMSWVKLNTFHWHITDSQSFPLGVAEFPELSQKGAYSTAEIYSPSDIREVVDYAGARGIDVLMEIDTPGHTSIISTSHPEHVACPGSTPWSAYANEPPAGQLRLASPATVNFTASLIGAVAKTLPSTMFSTGGDELNTACYGQDSQTQNDLKGRSINQALGDFTKATHGALHALNKTAVVWEEMVLEHNVQMRNDTIVMVWISSGNAGSVASRGYRIVHAPSDYFYLDCGAGEWIGNTAGSTSWCDPFKSWQKAYTFNPLSGVGQANLVLGGEQLLWTEQSSPENLDSIVWPRAASSAEVFWTGANLPDGRARSVTEALPRLHEIRYRMVNRGVKAIALQPHWCALRPALCEING